MQTSNDAAGELSNDPVPDDGQLLSNGRYSVLITRAGTGYSAFEGYALTRWNADRLQDGDGFFFYLRDLASGAVWSLGHQPAQKPASNYSTELHPGRFVITHSDEEIEARLEVSVAQDEDVEIRRVTLRNHSDRSRQLELTSYLEIVLNYPAADAAHPAFSKLFVQTEYLPELHALLAKRRPRSPQESPPWSFHSLVAEDPRSLKDLQFETDRVRFLGRGRSLADPRALSTTSPLSGTVGSVLDPVFSLRQVVELQAGATLSLAFLQGAAWSREAAVELARRYAQPGIIEFALQRASSYEEEERQRLGLSDEQSRYFQQLVCTLLYNDPKLRASTATLLRNRGQQADLWKYGLSGNLPLVIVRVVCPADQEILADLLKARCYWQGKGLAIDLLILDDLPRDSVFSKAIEAACADSDDNIKFLRSAEIAPQDLILLQAAAQLFIQGRLPDLQQATTEAATTAHYQPASAAPLISEAAWDSGESLQFFNGHGGFNAEGNEYVIRLEADKFNGLRRPPLPWINVIANEAFGFLISESGAGYTWSQNSRENRLTPWYNDPILDPFGEALYIRDEDQRVFWSPTPGPVPSGSAYEVRHGFGYTRYLHISHALEQEVCVFAPRHDPLKIARLKLTNQSPQPRRLSLFSYQQWVMGTFTAHSACFIATRFDAQSQAILATNWFNNEFAGRVCFAAVVAPHNAPVHFTADRAAFIGRFCSPARPAALCAASTLNGGSGAGLDPCAALQITVSLAPDETLTCSFLLGEAENENTVSELIGRYRSSQAIDNALAEVKAFWKDTLSAVQIKTPSPAIDLMVNGWLAYQNLSCRLWGRSAFYQSGGAFGFRDQLQDAAALIYLLPDLTRQQILLHAAHQFIEGDVLHWWHPPLSRGIHTRFSDDLLWLPYVTAFYIRTTGDQKILDEQARFLTARPLAEGEDEAYLIPADSGESADLYEHCCRALDRSLTQGAHGLPLMGTGDWNDGMNRVGREGRGESVWLGFFLYSILGDFIPICEQRGDQSRVQRYQAYRAQLGVTLNDTGWDGVWYRRAYYDNGVALGSMRSDECQIDALAQAWAVISKAAPQERAEQAMDAVEKHLILEKEGLIRLLTPAFDKTPQDPGYIKGYVPGIRENGGQYTHAALWVVKALAELGRGSQATALLEMLNPINHALNPNAVATYQVEPYVIAADVYGVAPHVGRGGWTWYTGSAGWMYRVALESVLGLQLLEGNTLLLSPGIPESWPEFSVRYRLADGKTTYEILVSNPRATAKYVSTVTLDENNLDVENGVAARIPLIQDGIVHHVHVMLGANV